MFNERTLLLRRVVSNEQGSFEAKTQEAIHSHDEIRFLKIDRTTGHLLKFDDELHQSGWRRTGNRCLIVIYEHRKERQGDY